MDYNYKLLNWNMLQGEASSFNACKPEEDDPIKSMNPRKAKVIAKNSDNLMKVLADRKKSKKENILSIQYLSNYETPKVEQLLAGRLKSAEDLSEKYALLGSLSEIGTKNSLEVLNELKPHSNSSLRSKLNLTKLLVSSRASDEKASLILDNLVKESQGMETTETVPIKLKPIEKKLMKEMVGSFYGSRFGIEFSETLGFELKSGIQDFKFLINKAAEALGEWGKTLNKPMILGILAKKSDLGGRVYQKYVVLSHPKKDYKLITAFKSNGELLLHAKLSLDKNDFLLSNSDRDKASSRNKVNINDDYSLSVDLQWFRKKIKKESAVDKA